MRGVRINRPRALKNNDSKVIANGGYEFFWWKRTLVIIAGSESLANKTLRDAKISQ